MTRLLTNHYIEKSTLFTHKRKSVLPITTILFTINSDSSLLWQTHRNATKSSKSSTKEQYDHNWSRDLAHVMTMVKTFQPILTILDRIQNQALCIIPCAMKSRPIKRWIKQKAIHHWVKEERVKPLSSTQRSNRPRIIRWGIDWRRSQFGDYKDRSLWKRQENCRKKLQGKLPSLVETVNPASNTRPWESITVCTSQPTTHTVTKANEPYL